MSAAVTAARAATVVVLVIGLGTPGSAPAVDLLQKAGSLLDALRQQDAAASAPHAAPVQTAAPATPGEANPAAGKVHIGRKQVTLSSAELDKHCKQVVEPFDLNANFIELTALAAAVLGDAAVAAVETGQAQVTESRHQLSRAVRERALRLNWLPMALEQRYGRYIHDQAVAAGDLVARDSTLGQRVYPAADSLLQTLLQGVSEPHPYTFELHVRKANEGNAVAMPGGIVYLDAGLLRGTDLSLARFALAHEIGHVLRRHETRIAQARIIDAISLTGNAKDLVAALRDPMSIAGHVLQTAAVGHKVFQQHYGDQELQADSCAVRIMDGALASDTEVQQAIESFVTTLPEPNDPGGIPPAHGATTGTPAPAAVNAMAALVVEVSSPVDRHPTTAKRVENLASLRARPVADGAGRPSPASQR